MRLTGSQILIECLKEQNVDTIFGYPGGAVLNIYDALYHEQANIKHILTSHEQGAAHAADGYARATGRVGVCLATSGPGATNLVTGIATAYMDSVPMVAITGQVPTTLLGKDSFQEVDITGITMPVTKHNFIVKKVEELAPIIRRAFAIAVEGRPGPVLVDICKDVTAASCDYNRVDFKSVNNANINIQENKTADYQDKLSQVVSILEKSNSPVIVVGGGVIISEAQKEVVQLSERLDIPVTSTLMGLGAFPGSHENYTGMLGMHGTKVSNKMIHNSDVLIAIGVRFSDRVISDVEKFAPNACIIHIDIDSAEISKNITAFIDITCDAKIVLQDLIKSCAFEKKTAWLKNVIQWKEENRVRTSNSIICNDRVLPKDIINTLWELTSGKAIITTEVGQNQLWASQHYTYDYPRSFLSSGGLGTMGYGLGASIGAQAACPHKKVINIAGDGSFRMNCNELATAVEYKLPVVICIMNNKVLGMVRQWQRLFYNKRYSHTNIDRGTDFVALANAFGAKGIRVDKKSQIKEALELALTSTDVPVVIDFVIHEDEGVFPIVPPGKAITEVIEA